MSNLLNDTRALEEAFFLAEDKWLIEKLRSMKQLAETKESLAAVSGIADPALLDKLIQLGIRPATLASLAAVPLVEVAWADGSIDPKERQAIIKSLEAPRFHQKVDRELVDHWLSHRPDPKLLEAWRHYVQALSAELTAHERQTLRDDLLGHARSVAEAAGGFLGLGAISAAEQAILDQLAQAWS